MSPQYRPPCPACGKWLRRDHRCPTPARVEVRKTCSTKRLPKLVHC